MADLCNYYTYPAFEKAADYFNVEIIHVPITSDCRIDVDAAAKAIDRNTLLLVGSASQYCHDVMMVLLIQ